MFVSIGYFPLLISKNASHSSRESLALRLWNKTYKVPGTRKSEICIIQTLCTATRHRAHRSSGFMFARLDIPAASLRRERVLGYGADPFVRGILKCGFMTARRSLSLCIFSAIIIAIPTRWSLVIYICVFVAFCEIGRMRFFSLQLNRRVFNELNEQ